MKIDKYILKKIVAQVEEAREQGLTSMANMVDEVIKHEQQLSPSENEKYSYLSLKEDINKQLWKSALQVIKYYDLKTANVEDIHNKIQILGEELLSELEETLKTSSVIEGPHEPKLFGQK